MAPAEAILSQKAPLIHSLPLSETAAVNLILRIGILACFVGHGVIGLMGNPGWLPLFAVAGISPPAAYQLMPLIGAMDILMGLVLFFRPVKILLVWALAWCLWTAIIRPLAGMSWFEFFERAANFGLPLALLVSTGTSAKGWRSWFETVVPRPMTAGLVKKLQVVLMLTTAMLLAGHGGYGLVLAKESLARHYASLGLGEAGQYVVLRLIGAAELFAAFLVLVYRSPRFLLGIAIWKVLTELLHPLSGASAWETVERGASYCTPLALAYLYTLHKKPWWDL